MKYFKFMIAAMLSLCLMAGALAQNQLPIDAGQPKMKPGEVQPMSISYTMTEKGIDFLYLNDGWNNLTAISYTIAPIGGTNGRLRLMALGAADPTDMQHKAYLTAGLGYNLFNAASGFRVDLFAGPKGFNVTNGFKWEGGSHSIVFGIGMTIPLNF